jgi:hypothetical protein
MEWNMVLGILFFLAGTILMPIGLKNTGSKRFILIAGSIASDLMGLVFLFY